MALAEFVIRAPSSRDDALAILETLNSMHDEIGRAPLNSEKAFIEISLIVQAGHARTIEQDGKIVATFGMRRSGWWFSDEPAFFSRWFFVAPEFRATSATRLLLTELSDLVEDEDTPAYVHVYESGQVKSGVRRIAEEIGCLPTGRVLLITKKVGG